MPRGDRSRTAAVLACAAALLAGACAPALVRPTPSEIARVLAEPEVLAVHQYAEPAKLAEPSGWRTGNPSPTDLGLLLLPGGLLLTLLNEARKEAAASQAPEIRLNVAPEVKEQVVADLVARGALAHVRLVREPVREDTREALERQFGTSAILLFFKTTDWASLTLPEERNRYGFPTALRAQLARAGGAKVLWEASCQIPAPGAAAAAPPSWATWLWERLNDAARACAAQVVRQWPAEGEPPR